MRKFINLSIWFWKESYKFIAPWRFRDYLYAPIAYIKFIKFSCKD